MEATSDYWKGVYYLLEAHGFEVWLVNARDIQAPPGTAQDRHPGRGLAVQARRAAAATAQLRPTTSDPAAAARDPLPGRPGRGPDRWKAAGGAGCRVDAQIKLSVVASDIFGVSGRAMGAALVAGERDPKVLAQLARARLRAKLGPLVEAFCGFFTDQHAFLLAKMLARVDQLDADLAELDAKIQELIAPFAGAVDRLDDPRGRPDRRTPAARRDRRGHDPVPNRWAAGVVGQVGKDGVAGSIPAGGSTPRLTSANAGQFHV
jgi:transposase